MGWSLHRAMAPLRVSTAGGGTDVVPRPERADATDPILLPIQRRLGPVGGIDFSPLIAIVLISVVESVLLSLLAGH